MNKERQCADFMMNVVKRAMLYGIDRDGFAKLADAAWTVISGQYGQVSIDPPSEFEVPKGWTKGRPLRWEMKANNTGQTIYMATEALTPKEATCLVGVDPEGIVSFVEFHSKEKAERFNKWWMGES